MVETILRRQHADDSGDVRPERRPGARTEEGRLGHLVARRGTRVIGISMGFVHLEHQIFTLELPCQFDRDSGTLEILLIGT